MLLAGRSRPPRESLPEQPVIPAGVGRKDQSTSSLDDQATARLLHLVTSPPASDARDGRAGHESSSPGVQTTSSSADESTSSLIDQVPSQLDDSSPEKLVGESAEKADETVTAPLSTKPPVDLLTSELVAGPGLPAPFDDHLVSSSPVAQLVEGAGADAPPLEPESGPLRDESPSGLVVESTSSQPEEPQVEEAFGEVVVTGPLDDQSASKVVTKSTSSSVDQDPEPLDDSTPEPLDDEASSELVAPLPVKTTVNTELAEEPTATQPLVTKSPRPRAPRPPSAHSAAPVPAARAPVGDATGTYQRLTVFLTPAQRTWLKNTGRQLPVEGLSVSDIVRLAVTRLSIDVNEGLPLVEELTALAYSDAETMAGRRNRGLPPK